MCVCVMAEALAYTPSQNCCSLSKVYDTSNSIAQVTTVMIRGWNNKYGFSLSESLVNWVE